MLTLDTKAVRFLARMGARGTLGQAIYDYACDGNEVYAVSADLVYASGFERLLREFPERIIDVGIAEQNLIGVSAGLASTGIPVVATTWAMFATARVADQVRNFMGYMQGNIKLIGMDSGFIQSRFSYSHSNPPDIAVMRAIPGVTILSPCDGIETYKAISAALEYKGPVYIRLTGAAMMPIVHKNPDIEYRIGKAITLVEGTDAAIVATGNVVKYAVDAADMLKEKGISVKVIDMHTIQPLDIETLDTMKEVKLVVSVEEHLRHGGMGSAVAEYYSSCEVRPRHIILGVDNCYPASGSVEYATECAGLSAKQIADTIYRELNKGE